MSTTVDRDALVSDRYRIARTHLRMKADRPASSARSVHHVALICGDVARTVRFHQEILELSLTEVFENRDLHGSNHFFFDLGNGNAIAFFDLPGVDPSPYAEVLGGLHHLAISVEPERWKRLKSNLDTAGVEYAHARSRCTSVTSTAPGLELIADPLGEMYGSPVV